MIPSEEEKNQMNPMDFEEFLWALGDNATMPMLKKIYDNKHSIGNDINRILIRKFRLYMLIGGMPQVITTYLETNNFRNVDNMKRTIINLYEDDLRKIDSTGRLGLFLMPYLQNLVKILKDFK